MTIRYMQCLVTMALAGLMSVASANSTPTWPVSPSRLALDTPYGTLNIASNEYVYESQLRINDDDINPSIKGILNITYAFSMPKAQIALVSINSGNNGCPVSYRWIILQKSGYTVSPEFGSCSEHIKVSAKGRLFTMQTPSQNRDKIDIYTYDGKTIKRRTAPHP
jgi:outer membrane protease